MHKDRQGRRTTERHSRKRKSDSTNNGPLKWKKSDGKGEKKSNESSKERSHSTRRGGEAKPLHERRILSVWGSSQWVADPTAISKKKKISEEKKESAYRSLLRNRIKKNHTAFAQRA